MKKQSHTNLGGAGLLSKQSHTDSGSAGLVSKQPRTDFSGGGLLSKVQKRDIRQESSLKQLSPNGTSLSNNDDISNFAHVQNCFVRSAKRFHPETDELSEKRLEVFEITAIALGKFYRRGETTGLQKWNTIDDQMELKAINISTKLAIKKKNKKKISLLRK